jgi:crotonobetainyl-CoA:carnitine CoA-transferase CaiB-like acyl-CoA transferase
VTDLTAGFYATFSILAAYVDSLKTGKGAWLDVSMFDCQVLLSFKRICHVELNVL